MYANEVETKRKEKLPEKRNNYNINKNPWKYKALLKTFHLNSGIIKDCPQIESLLCFFKKQANKNTEKNKAYSDSFYFTKGGKIFCQGHWKVIQRATDFLTNVTKS